MSQTLSPSRPQSTKPYPRARKVPAPSWQVAQLFPTEGQWSEGDYLLLPTKRLVELSNGSLEVLPAPTRIHQQIVAFLYQALLTHARAKELGSVYFAPLPLRLWEGKYREPDVIFVSAHNKKALEGEYLQGADLVMEVVSSRDALRDYRIKRREYARARIAEYWIADSGKGALTILRLKGTSYVIHGTFRKGQRAASALLPGFTVGVEDVFASK